MLCENIERNDSGELIFAGYNVQALAAKYGTPLYLMDEGRIRRNCRMYKEAMRNSFGGGRVLYAGKAACFKRIYGIIDEEGLSADVVSSGEIYTAVSAGFPADKLYFHGNAKTDDDIAFAIEKGVGYFVVDNMEELFALDRAAFAAGIRQKVLLRVTPGIDPHTYAAISTGKVDSKFGLPIETGQAKDFAAAALGLENIEVRGLHCHVGSQVVDEDVYERAADIMLPFMASLRDTFGVTLHELDMGGGFGVRYLETCKPVDIPARIASLAAHMKSLCARIAFPMPELLLEPGRSIVADAGMTLYTVSSVKEIYGYKSYAAIDGGMADNPRYALYGAPYTVLDGVQLPERRRFDLAGRCCESGDLIQPGVELNAELKRGDIVAVCTTGAYNYSMASNYNRIPRPAIVMLAPDGDYLAVKRESFENLTKLDV